MKLTNWQVLSDKEIASINEASLEILEKTGLLVESDSVRSILEDGGAEVSGQTVRFPRTLVEESIAKNVPVIQMTDREGRELFRIGDGSIHFAGGHNAVFVMEGSQGERRNSTLKDVEDFAVLCEQLEDIDIVGVPLNPFDVPAKNMLAHAVAGILRNSRKPVFFSSESREVNLEIIEMAKATTGFSNFKERSSMISQLSTTSPLFWEAGAAEALVECARIGMPLAYLPQPIAGMTAPYTIAGNITLHNAEVLSGVVIAHLVNPGTPQIYASAWTSYDMRYSNVIIGRPEEALMRVAGAQLAHFYRMPSHTIGPDADANINDEQLGWEKMMSVLAAVSGGNDLIVNAGMFGTGMTITYEQLLLDNEMNRFARRMHEGIAVSEQTIASQVIQQVGPRGTFLDADHTLDFLRSGEHIEPTVITGMNYENWRRAGAKNCSQLASEKVQELLNQSNSAVLNTEKGREINLK